MKRHIFSLTVSFLADYGQPHIVAMRRRGEEGCVNISANIGYKYCKSINSKG